jgi:hypothetical protein
MNNCWRRAWPTGACGIEWVTRRKSPEVFSLLNDSSRFDRLKNLLDRVLGDRLHRIFCGGTAAAGGSACGDYRIRERSIHQDRESQGNLGGTPFVTTLNTLPEML